MISLLIKSLEVKMPKIYDELLECRSVLEKHYGDMQDIEFTVQGNKLFLLQTRNGKRTAEAAIKIAVDMVHEGKINTNDALIRVEPKFEINFSILLWIIVQSLIS